MDNSIKQRWLSVFFMICIILFLINIPFEYLIDNKIILFILDIIFYIVAFIVFFYLNKKDNISNISLEKPKLKDFLFIPFLIICISNIFVGLINNALISNKNNYIVLDIIIISLSAIIEELLFRQILLSEFRKYNNPLLSILFSSLIFGAIHLLNITTPNTIGPCFLQTLYTFFLGLMLGLIFLCSKNIIYPIIYHVIFNIFNGVVFSNLFVSDWNITFFTVNIIITILALIYGIIIYKINKKELN